jgi:metal-dependent hydrolase (beta-lactamase superfamily II)
VDGLKTVGLDPANYQIILVSHAHTDHGGSVSPWVVGKADVRNYSIVVECAKSSIPIGDGDPLKHSNVKTN